VNYNTGDYLERCLASLEIHRGDLDTDVLVIDNASVDGSHTRRSPHIHGSV
jgi:GT2 family glycosyltransferase